MYAPEKYISTKKTNSTEDKLTGISSQVSQVLGILSASVATDPSRPFQRHKARMSP